MKSLSYFAVAALVSAVLFAPRPAAAHHSFAMFNTDKQVLVEGTVTKWAYNSPHSWLYVKAPDANGEMQTWSFEGAAPVHATRQGVTGRTYAYGEHVRVVMSPIRDGRTAGALCFVIKDDGTITRPNDGTCDSEKVAALWKKNGWIESTKHLEGHPTAR